MTVQLARVSGPPGRWSRYLAPAVLAVLVAAIVGVVLYAPGRSGSHPGSATQHATVGKLPPYWIVRAGDTFTQIAARTRLSVNQLEAFNPQADPNALVPGERLNLWRHPPVPRPPPPGPMFWTVQSGQSFGSIAAKTGINIAVLERLNPQLKASSLQPGDRVRLRR